jgi:hypothetical protein
MLSAASYPPLQKTQGRGTHGLEWGTENRSKSLGHQRDGANQWVHILSHLVKGEYSECRKPRKRGNREELESSGKPKRDN